MILGPVGATPRAEVGTLFSPRLEWHKTCTADWWVRRKDPGGRKTLSILESESIQVRVWFYYTTYTRKSTSLFHMGHNFLQFYLHFWSFSKLWVTGWHDFSGGWLTEKRLFLSFIYIFGTVLWSAPAASFLRGRIRAQMEEERPETLYFQTFSQDLYCISSYLVPL